MKKAYEPAVMELISLDNDVIMMSNDFCGEDDNFLMKMLLSGQ